MKLFGVVGWKNTGKTGLTERLVAEFSARGLSVSTVKHAHHRVDVDQPGTDSHRHRMAGAREVLLASSRRWAMMHELRGDDEPSLQELLTRLGPADLVLVEGFKRAGHPKIETHRKAAGTGLIALEDVTIRAIASDGRVEADARPVFDLDDTEAIADFILAELGLGGRRSALPPADGGQTSLRPPRLKNDCFALPPGVNWTPVEEALARLRAGLSCVTGNERLKPGSGLGRILAAPAIAGRANPPEANSAVDGYGFAHSTTGGSTQILPLVEGRAAAGAAFKGEVPRGLAIRILTGASLPDGVDTVVLDEDVSVEPGRIAFAGPVKRGSNTRRAGEDVEAGEVLFATGHCLTPADLALLAATGAGEVTVRRPLRVGVLSTGDEIVPAGRAAPADRIYDANRPMLLALAERWGHEAIDLGHVRDDRGELQARLDLAAREADAIVTSGGASAGDEDHVSALLKHRGSLQSWRIAIKPGRPLALALWQGVPVFGLPGNPVAAFLCSLIFARPALSVLAGGAWLEPRGMMVPAAFSKSKKPGRREYLRARLTPDGAAEVFHSEGSGRISGLSWAEGLVELPDGAMQVGPGTRVRYLPFSDFGL